MKIRTKLTLIYLLITVLLWGAVFIVLEELLYPREGYDMLRILNVKLLTIWAVSFAVLFLIGYFMARKALRPVSKIVRQVGQITASNLSRRVETDNPKDETGELAATFNDMLDRLEASFEAQKMFVSNVSHELRTPMSALIAELELSLHRERSIEDYKKVVGSALADARKIEKLSTGLLDLAKASYQADQIGMQRVRPDEILLDASATVMKAGNGYSVNLTFDEPDGAGDEQTATVTGNEYLLRTAFVNLMENSCKFSHNHTSTVQISFPDNQVHIRFSDTGIGIPSEDMAQLFKPFYRGKNRYFSEGSGIGLALVERIVKLHGGTVSVASRPGEGTVFTLVFGCAQG